MLHSLFLTNLLICVALSIPVPSPPLHVFSPSSSLSPYDTDLSLPAPAAPTLEAHSLYLLNTLTEEEIEHTCFIPLVSHPFLLPHCPYSSFLTKRGSKSVKPCHLPHCDSITICQCTDKRTYKMDSSMKAARVGKGCPFDLVDGPEWAFGGRDL
jgi:hypothetical protein